MSFIALGTAIAGIAGASATTAAAIGAGAGVLAKGYAGYKASQVDTGAMVGGAKDLSLAERAQLGQENKLAMEKINLNLEQQTDTLQKKGSASMYEVYAQEQNLGMSGFANNEQAEMNIDIAKASIHSDYSTNVDSIMKQAELNRQGISLGSEKSKADIEQRLQNNITQASSVADTFWEGFTGQSNYKIG
tara:strand:- start:7299 stop:7868 length:570 start_codon:yes stop_codon:yes gene_type:complete